MRVEDAIKQSVPFRSEYERLAVNVMVSAAWVNEQVRQYLERFDITPQQYNVLRILRGQKNVSISTSDIRERMIDRSPDTSRIVDRLVAKKLVEKNICPSDKRRVDVLITRKGLSLLQSISNDDMDEIFTTISVTKAQELNTLLDMIRGAYNDKDIAEK